MHIVPPGAIKDVRLLTEKESGKSRGCGYVEFCDELSHKVCSPDTLAGITYNILFF